MLILIFPAFALAQPKNEAERLWELGDKAYKEKRYQEAISYYQQSLKKCGNDNECYASNYNGLGAAYEDLARDDEALRYYERAIEAARKLGNREWLADDLMLAGVIYYRRSIDYGRAVRYLEESRRIFTELGNKDSLAIVLHNLGRVSEVQGKYDRALAYFQESSELYRAKGDEQSVGANLANMGRVYAHMGRLKEARSRFEEALGIAKSIRMPTRSPS